MKVGIMSRHKSSLMNVIESNNNRKNYYVELLRTIQFNIVSPFPFLNRQAYEYCFDDCKANKFYWRGSPVGSTGGQWVPMGKLEKGGSSRWMVSQKKANLLGAG